MCVSFPEVTDNKSLPSHPAHPTRGVSLIFKKGNIRGERGVRQREGWRDGAGVGETVRNKSESQKPHQGQRRSVVFKGRQFSSSPRNVTEAAAWLKWVWQFSCRRSTDIAAEQDKAGRIWKTKSETTINGQDIKHVAPTWRQTHSLCFYINLNAC